MATCRETIPLRTTKVIKKVIWGVLKGVAAGVLLFFIVSPFWLRVLGSLPDSVTAAFERAMTALPLPSAVTAIVCLYIIYQCLYYKRYFYDIVGNVIVIRKGALFQTEMAVPLAAVTDVRIDRDLLDLLLGTHDLHISIPTEESAAFAHIDGLSRKGAVAVREKILTAVSEEKR